MNALKRRWVPSDSAKALLETIFSADSFPTFTVRSQLAQQLGIDARQVQIWFQVMPLTREHSVCVLHASTARAVWSGSGFAASTSACQCTAAHTWTLCHMHARCMAHHMATFHTSCHKRRPLLLTGVCLLLVACAEPASAGAVAAGESIAGGWHAHLV